LVTARLGVRTPEAIRWAAPLAPSRQLSLCFITLSFHYIPLRLSTVREPIGYLNQLMSENEVPVNHPGRTSRRLLVSMQGRSPFSLPMVLGVIRVQPVRVNPVRGWMSKKKEQASQG